MKQNGTDPVTPCLKKYIYFGYFLSKFSLENGSIGLRRGGPVRAVFMYPIIIYFWFLPQALLLLTQLANTDILKK